MCNRYVSLPEESLRGQEGPAGRLRPWQRQAGGTSEPRGRGDWKQPEQYEVFHSWGYPKTVGLFHGKSYEQMDTNG